MDLHLIPGAEATAQERSAVDAVLGPPPSAWQGANRTELDTRVARAGDPVSLRSRLLPTLRALQLRAGWISPGALNYVGQRLGVPPAEAYGVASFYALLSTHEGPRHVVHVCDDIACRTRGAERICKELERTVGPEGVVTARGSAWHRSPCLGHCERGSAALIQHVGESPREWIASPVTAAEAASALGGATPAPEEPREPAASRGAGSPWAPQTGASSSMGLELLRRVGRVDPTSLEDYRSSGGLAALRKALELGPAGVIKELLDSRLVGRGGAAFPAGKKWEAVARAPARPHYFVCNADESEPGTFKDRVLLEEDPYAVVEAMTIAGLATESSRGYVYIRGEYPLAAKRIDHAIREARRAGLLGDKILGSGLTFDLELYRGAGAYICGEETALFNSIEGYRGEPRNKPPFPSEAGLFGKPTGVNNVETLANVLRIVERGGSAFAAQGTGQSTGTKLFCLSGSVARPGVYEHPFGLTLRQVIEAAGGLLPGRKLQAVLLGGAAGTFVTPEELDTPLTFEGARSIGASLGSGVVLVLDDSVDLRDIVLRIAAFFRDESCGQCVPCRVGTVRVEESLHRLAAGRPLGTPASEGDLVNDLGKAMRDASICGLGQTAFLAVESALRKLKLFQGNNP